jgi:DNA-cytosine methyltransferase
MKILSLFDGISCAQIALNKLGIKYDNYFASEICKNAIKVTQDNYPDTIQLGDVTNWKDWKLPKIDMICAGFPCQSWSKAGLQGGFKDERGKLAYVLADIFRHLKEQNPNLIFLFENVEMGKEKLNDLNELFGCEGVKINSSLLTAQRRGRVYWTNLKIDSIEDKQIKFQDILDDGLAEKEKAYCIKLCRGNARDYFKKKQTNIVFCPNKHGKYKVENGLVSMTFPKGKDPNELFTFKCAIPDGNYDVRPLNRNEVERLQTIPQNYTNAVSVSAAHNLMGNSWTVDVICHILKNVK